MRARLCVCLCVCVCVCVCVGHAAIKGSWFSLLLRPCRAHETVLGAFSLRSALSINPITLTIAGIVNKIPLRQERSLRLTTNNLFPNNSFST